MRELLNAIGRLFDVALAHPLAAIALWLCMGLISAIGTAAGKATYGALRRVVVRRWQRRRAQ